MLVNISFVNFLYDALKRGSRTWVYYKKKWNRVHDYLMSQWKITDFQSFEIILKDWEQWKKIISSHCITYLGFKYEKWPHEKKMHQSCIL